MSSLAILILTKNEEDNIVDVVKNAKKCTDDVIIIDSGSTDKTVTLAEGQGLPSVFAPGPMIFQLSATLPLSRRRPTGCCTSMPMNA